MVLLRACGARPSGGMSQGEVALRGRAGDSAKGGFLGGARSPRPQIRAGRKPRRVMIAGGKRRTEGAGETCPGEADSVPAGVQSPPLRETGTLTRRASGFKARCIGKARCRYYGRAEPAPPRPRSATRRTGGPKRGSAPVRRDADITGVGSPPLRETGTPTRRTSGSKGETPG